MHPIYIMFYLGLHNYVLFLQILLHVLISTMVIYILQRQGLIRPIMLPSHCKTTLKTSYMCVIKAALMEYYQSILLYMLRLNLLLMYDTIQVQRGKCVLFSIVYYTVLYSPLKVCFFLCEAIKHTLRNHKHDPQRHWNDHNYPP